MDNWKRAGRMRRFASIALPTLSPSSSAAPQLRDLGAWERLLLLGAGGEPDQGQPAPALVDLGQRGRGRDSLESTSRHLGEDQTPLRTTLKPPGIVYHAVTFCSKSSLCWSSGNNEVLLFSNTLQEGPRTGRHTQWAQGPKQW